VYDTVSARRAGTASTGSAVRGGIAGSPSAGCRALQLAPGHVDQAEILRRVGNGVFVESLIGVHSGVNPVSGDFSVGVTGLMIRDGQLAEPVREITVPPRCSGCCSTSSRSETTSNGSRARRPDRASQSTTSRSRGLSPST